ncbi:MAG TPA: hypothetical protein VM734_30415 [Kofleriaceae bacterium]|nr:hypothetical protein [Kofleriaceae bacterium]
MRSRFDSLVIRGALALGALAIALAIGAGDAKAQVACDTLPNPVYMQIGDTQQPLIKELGRALRDNTPNPITIVYITSGSCTNITAVYNNTPVTMNMLYAPSVAEDPNWTTAMPARSCTAPAGGAIPDIGNSNVFISACDPNPVPANVDVYHGPVQAYVLAVPEASTQTSITAEEAYFVFGFGPAGMITPWDDLTKLEGRTNTKSTLLSWAYNLGVLPVTKWKGNRHDGSNMVVQALLDSTTPEKSIGILGVEVYDQYRNMLDVLAFRGYGQWAAYYPDSTASALDKKNVRDGHYTVWSPTIYLTRKPDPTPTAAQVRARYVVDLIIGRSTTPAPNFNSTAVVMHNGLVPDCAMKVQRSSEGGNLSLYQPPEDCTCYFDSQTSSTSCATCSASNPCASGTCRNGYCEVR